jgi:hypothetical protein
MDVATFTKFTARFSAIVPGHFNSFFNPFFSSKVMKKLFTLAAAGTLAVASFSAQAQITVDGVITAAEIGTANSGKYVSLGAFTGTRGFGDWGLLRLYAANTGSKVYFFVAGTVEAAMSGAGSQNSFQLYLDLPGVPGAAASPTALPKTLGSGTSFENMGAKLDMAPDMGLALKGDAAGAYLPQGIVYSSSTAATSRTLGSALLQGTGAPLTLASTATTAPFTRLANARMAYRNTSSSNILTNPGNANGGAAGSYGWEIELDRTALGFPAGTPTINVFLVMNNGDGGYVSSDFIPQNTGPLPAGTFPNLPNLATDPDFAAVPGTQSAPFNIVVLGTKAADEASVAMSVYPNPAGSDATVSYRVLDRAQDVNIVLTDLTGRTLQVLHSGLQSAGTQSVTLNKSQVAAGTYMVRVQVGDRVATRKVVLL